MKYSYSKHRDFKKGYMCDDKDKGRDGGYDDGHKGGGGVDNPQVIPEINAGGTAMAFVLTGGLLMLMRERRRRGLQV